MIQLPWALVNAGAQGYSVMLLWVVPHKSSCDSSPRKLAKLDSDVIIPLFCHWCTLWNKNRKLSTKTLSGRRVGLRPPTLTALHLPLCAIAPGPCMCAWVQDQWCYTTEDLNRGFHSVFMILYTMFLLVLLSLVSLVSPWQQSALWTSSSSIR